MDAIPPIAGALAAALIAPGALRAFAGAGWTRENYRGAALPIPAGAVAAVAGVLAYGALGALDALADTGLLASDRAREGAGSVLAGDPAALAALLLGVGLLGLLDDLFEGEPRGWRGHFGAVLRGGWSTGVVKAVGTPALAVLPFAGAGLPAGEVLLAVAVIALAANLFNLLDLRPGRSAKSFVLLAAALTAATGHTGALAAAGPLAGALLVLGLYDLRERAMLGDTGSNVLGAIAGVWLVVSLGTTGQAVAAAVLVALTVYGEVRSFTATIERLAPLRLLDGLGRPRAS